MSAVELDLALNTLIDQLTPTWVVSPHILRDAAEKALILADAADELGAEGCWLRDAAQEVYDSGYHRPWTEADHLRAKLAGLSVTIGQPSQLLK